MTAPALTRVPPPTVVPDLLDRLRADLARIDAGAIEAELGPEAVAALEREERTPALLATRAPGISGAVAALVRIFLLGEPGEGAELRQLFRTLGVDGAARLGLVTLHGDTARAAVDLTPVAVDDGGPLSWFTSDLGERHTGRAIAADHVLGVGGASLTLAGITPRVPVGRALDLGTGCGIQAAQLARHAGAVVATDISRRALAFARFNAALAGQAWDLRRGSLLEPVAGEAFDLVVSNPPFVITPPAVHAAGLPVMEYRDAARPGDDLLRLLLSGLHGHLAPGGTAVMLANWEHGGVGSGDWKERIGAWAPGLDLWIVQREELSSAQYVEMWLGDGGLRAGESRGRYEAAYAAWLGTSTAAALRASGSDGWWPGARPPTGRRWSPWKRPPGRRRCRWAATSSPLSTPSTGRPCTPSSSTPPVSPLLPTSPSSTICARGRSTRPSSCSGRAGGSGAPSGRTRHSRVSWGRPTPNSPSPSSPARWPRCSTSPATPWPPGCGPRWPNSTAPDSCSGWGRAPPPEARQWIDTLPRPGLA